MINSKIIDSIKEDIYEYIHTGIPASVIDFDHVHMTATVQILAKLKVRGIEQIPKAIFKVPVGHSRVKSFAERFPVKKGDIAMLQFSEITLEKILDSGVYEEVVDTSKFDISDAVITSFLSKSKDKLPNDNKDDYCLYNLNSGHKIIFKENGEIEVFTKKLSLNVEESIEIETPIINALNTQFNVKGIKAESIITDTLNSLKSAIIKGIDFLSHIHSGVKGGPDKTQGPE